MKNTLIIIGAIIVLAAVGYGIAQTMPDRATKPPPVIETTTYRSSPLGIEFTYRSGERGYVLAEAPIKDPAHHLVKAFTLMRSVDAAQTPPIGGEGPPVMAIYVFGNPEKQFPQTWADNHLQYSNIDLAMGQVREAVVGGANAIRYRADGLYASEVAVVAHGDSMYLIIGQFIEENSDIRRDFEPLLASIRFIPKPGQE